MAVKPNLPALQRGKSNMPSLSSNSAVVPTYAWTGKKPSDMSILEKTAFLRMNSNKTGAREAFNALADEMRSPSSRHYSPYLTGRSNQKEAVEFFGRDSFDQDWLDRNRFLLNYTNQLDWTDTVSTSGQAKWTAAQKAGYYWWKLNEAEQTTQQAETEWASLRNAMQQNFNEYKRLYGEAPSYDKLMSYINMNDYSTLQKMDKVYDNVEDLVRLNRPVDYSPETVLGVYAALVNGKDVTGNGDYFEDAIQYTMQPVRTPERQPSRANYRGWTQDQIDARREEIRRSGTRAQLAQFEADLYASTPRLESVDSTSYFGESYYDQAFLDKYAYLGEYAEQLRNREGKIEKPASSDPWWYGAAYEYNTIRDREATTAAAEAEWKALREELAGVDAEADPEDVIAYIDWEQYPTLDKLRKGQDVQLNRPVYFSDEALLGVLKASRDGQKTDNDDLDYALYQTPQTASDVVIEDVPAAEEQKRTVSGLPTFYNGTSGQAQEFQGPALGARQLDQQTAFDQLQMKPEIAGMPTVAEERIAFMDNLWSDVTAKDTSDAMAIEKAFYAEHGRHMSASERIRAGLELPPMSGAFGFVPELGVMDIEKQSIFTDEMNAAASKMINPKTGEGYANMDELLANDPAALSDMLDYIEATPEQTDFTTEDVRAFREIQQYQEEVGNQGMDVLFRTYADDNAVDDDRLYASLQYIVESGLTLEEKSRLGLLDDSLTGGERLERAAELSQELFVERGDELTRAMAIAMLPKDAPEGWVNLVDAGLSNLFAVETGIVGGLMRTQALLPSVARDVWSAAMTPIYTNKLGADYTLDEACEIDPILRGLTAANDQIGTVVDVASPDMSSYGYGASVTRFITEAAVNQKVMNAFAPGARSFVDSTLKRMGLGNLGSILAGGGGIGRFFSRALDATKGALPWMLRSMSESAEEARELGASETDALRYGTWSAGTTGLIEGVLGQAYDGLLDKGSNLISKGLGKICKGGMSNLAQSKGFAYVTNLLQQVMGESAEGLAEMPLEKVGRSLIFGDKFSVTGDDWNEAWQNAGLEGVASIFTALFFGFTADRGSKTYTDSERFADRLVNGEVNIDEVIEYMADPESTPTSREVREAARVIEQNQAAMDEAAVEMAAEEVVAQQIDAGALDDINGEASSNTQAIRTQEADVQTAQQEVDELALQIEETDNQKRAALYDMVSNGISAAKGAARQLIHNLDEAKAALVRKQQEAAEKLAEKQKALQLKIEEVDAQIAERLKQLEAAAMEQERKELGSARMKADDAVRTMREAMESEESSEVSGRTAAVDRRAYSEDVSDNLVGQIVGVDDKGDLYAPFSAESKENPQFESQAEANRAAHYAGTDVVPDVSLDDEGDGFFTVTREQYDKYEMLLKELPKEGFELDRNSLMRREYDADNRPDDPIANATDRALVTVAVTSDNEYVLVKDTERANKGGENAYLLLRKPDFEVAGSESTVNQEASNILDAIDARLAELDRMAQNPETTDERLQERIAAVEKLRRIAGGFVRNGRQRELLDRFESYAASGNKQGLDAQELTTIMNGLPDVEGNGAFNLDDYVIGRFSRQNEALQAITSMGKGVRHVSGGKPAYRISMDLLNAIPDPTEFIDNMADFDLEGFAAANPRLFGAAESVDESWKPEDLSQRYVSKLANDNPNYVVVDSSGGFNLVVPKRYVQLDASNTGRDNDVNRGVATVTDAINALEAELSRDADQISDERAKGYSRKHDPMRVIYTTYDENGQPVNRTYLDYVDPKTGTPRVPTVRDLLANSSRVTVNWVRDWERANPNETPRLDPKTGKVLYDAYGNALDPKTRKRWKPKSVSGEKLLFTLERNDLAPNAYDPTSPNASMILMQADLHRAEADYNRHVGEGASLRSKLIYFKRVCEANFNSYVRAINELNIRMSNPGLTDAELATVQQRAEECREALVTWRYFADRVDEAMKAKGYAPGEKKVTALEATGIGKVLDKYNELAADGGNASLQSRTAMAALLRRSMLMDQIRQVEAELPTDATIQSLEAKRAELTAALEQVVNSRNQPPVAGMATPSATNNEPLTQALLEAIDVVDRQIEIVSARPAEEAPAVSEPGLESAEAPAEEAAEQAPEASGEVSENPENETENTSEETDPVSKQQEMDRAYLEAVVNPEPEAEEKPDMIDMETGEFVKNDEAVNGEFANVETGEIEYRQDIPAEELSWTAPVEEYMKRAGLVGEYDDLEIDSRSAHDKVEEQAERAYAAALSLTRRIDEMQTYLKSDLAATEDVDAIRQNMQTYIKKRNRLKAVAKQRDEQLMRSDYTSKKTIDSIAQHSVETGEIPWEELEGRRDDISAVYDNEIEGMRSRMNERLYAGKTSALTMNDVAYVIGSDELTKTLQRNFETAQSIMSEVHYREKLLKDAQEQLAKLDEDTRKNGMTLENEARRGKLVSRINLLETEIENGRKTARTFYDSGSELSLEDILSGSEGGSLPLNVMNRIFAILKDVDAHSNTTNRKTGILSDFDNPLRVMEHFTGEWAPVLNAIYFGNIQPANAALKRERGDIVAKLKKSGVNHKNSADAMRYAEGKMTEEELEQKYPDSSERNAIRRGVQEYRDVYEALWQEVNSALTANGFDPIPHRKNYVHHVKEARSAIAKACSMLGIRITEDELPTSLAGHTEELKPRRGHMNAAMERHGDDTRYDLERNTMAYVDAALRVIHHTGNISRLRQLEGIADQTVNKRMKNAGLNQYGDLVNTDDLKRPGRSNRTAFSSLREWVTEYTNLLAGKQSLYDRPLEHASNRNLLQVFNGLKGMVGSSIVVGNLNIATTNILPVMTMAGIAPAQTAAAIADVVAGGKDGLTSFEAQSDFLTARFADQQFDMNWVDKLTGKVMIPFEAVDRFAANVAVRAYQKMGMKKGWSPEVAMKWADQMAWRMMASKNLGEGANIQSAKGLGIALQFSREGINNLQFLAHDLPAISSGTGDWLKKLLGIMLGGWLYNAAFNKTTALEPVTPTMQSVREWDSDKSLFENLGNAAGNYAEMLNPTNLGTGGDLDNIPLVSAIGDMGKAAGNMAGAVVSGDGAGFASGLDDFFTATLGFVPGGLTIDRIRGAIGDYYRGYTTDDKGNIKFTIDNDLFSAGSIHDAIFTLLLSESGTLGGREYTRSGYKTMTSTQTEAFHNQKDQGKSNKEAFDAVKGYTEARGNNDARGMILPDWATAEVDTDWMQAVIAAGPAAYPSKAPDSLTIDGVKYELSDEEKMAFDSSYKTAYKMHIQGAMKRGESLKEAADKAYRAAINRFKEKLEE